MPPRSPEQTVYSYLFPEVRDLVHDVLHYDAGDIVNTLRENVTPGLDNVHYPVMEKFKWHLAEHRVPVDDFAYEYPVNGSSEALFHLIAKHVANDPLGISRIWTLEGEYQGFEAYASALGTTTSTLTEKMVLEGNYPGGLFLVSNPSSRDGNYLKPEVYYAIVNKPDNQVILDLAYVGMADPMRRLDTSKVAAVVASMSKPWGLYYFRVGFAWTREPVDSLYGNKWFKNIPSLKVAEAVLNHLPARLVREKYRPIQYEILSHEILSHHREHVRASDVWLLAYEDDGPSEYVRAGNRARYCLTPKFQEWESR